jgi:hypothetical protein
MADGVTPPVEVLTPAGVMVTVPRAALAAMFPKARPCVLVIAMGVIMRAVAEAAAVAEEP